VTGHDSSEFSGKTASRWAIACALPFFVCR
jgi:hypothetical protein